MITKEQAKIIAEKYLQEKKREYSAILDTGKIKLRSNSEILFGKYEGKEMQVYSVGYTEMWGDEERLSFIKISAETGEILYSINSHGWIEELEEE